MWLICHSIINKKNLPNELDTNFSSMREIIPKEAWLFVYYFSVIQSFSYPFLELVALVLICSEIGIYKRKQESKKTRTRPRKRRRQKDKTFFFSWSLSWSSSCFLTFLFSFINSHLWVRKIRPKKFNKKNYTKKLTW